MKAVVLEITDGEATVMTKNGDIRAIRDNGYEIGQEIEYGKTVSARKFTTLTGLISAVAAVLVIFTGSGLYVYMKPYGTVSLDVNPSIEYTINRIDRVLSVTGTNEDGEDLLIQLDVSQIKNRSIDTAVENTIEMISESGYFTDSEEDYVVVSAGTDTDKHTDELLTRLDMTVREHKGLKAITIKVSEDDINKAHSEGLSAGKMVMVDRLMEGSDDKKERDSWKKKNVREIVREYDRRNAEREINGDEPEQPREEELPELQVEPDKSKQLQQSQDELEQPQQSDEPQDEPGQPQQPDKPQDEPEQAPHEEEIPERPVQPDQPKQPQQPQDKPEKPQQPDQPQDEPEQPPHEEEIPEHPVQPDQPEKPQQPDQPQDEPVQPPREEEIPEHPVQPDQPDKPQDEPGRPERF